MTDGLSTESNKTEVILGMKIDKELNFDEHVNYLWKSRSEAQCSRSYCNFYEY